MTTNPLGFDRCQRFNVFFKASLSVADLDPLPVYTLPVEDPGHIDRELTNITTGALQVGELYGLDYASRKACDRTDYIKSLQTICLCHWDTIQQYFLNGNGLALAWPIVLGNRWIYPLSCLA